MAEHSPNGRNSQGVSTVLFIRTDFPQQGWNRVAVYVYAAANFPSISQLSNSFRNVRDRELGLAAVLFRRTDFPENGWISFVANSPYTSARGVPAFHQLANSYRYVRDRSLYRDGEKKISQGTNNGESPAPAEFGWFTHEEIIRVFSQRADLSAHQQAQPPISWMGFAANIFYDPSSMSGWIEPLGGFRQGSNRRYQQDTNRDLTWALSSQQQLVGLAAISQLSESFRLVRDRSLYHDQEKRPVQGSSASNNVIPEYDPQIVQWVVPNHRTKGKPYWTSTGPSIDWINNPVSQASSNPATHPWAIHSQFVRKTRPEQMSWTKSGFFISLFYNPAQAGWTVNSQRVPGGPWWTSPDPTVDWISPTLRAPFDTTLRSDVLDSQRVPSDPYWTSKWQGNDWLNPGLLGAVSFDPRTEDWSIKTSTYRSRKWWSDSPMQQAWLVPSAKFDPVLWPSTAIPSHRDLPKLTGRWQPDLDNAWLTENPPVPVTFRPSFATQANQLNDQGGSPVEAH